VYSTLSSGDDDSVGDDNDLMSGTPLKSDTFLETIPDSENYGSTGESKNKYIRSKLKTVFLVVRKSVVHLFLVLISSKNENICVFTI